MAPAALIWPSQLALDELRDAGLTVPAVIISNGVPEQFAPLASRPHGPFTVLTVGRLVPEKHQDLVLEAVRLSKHGAELRVVIAGKGPCQPKLEALAKASPAQVELGFRSDDDLLWAYQTADLYEHLYGQVAQQRMRW